jgi:hypothetical protein
MGLVPGTISELEDSLMISCSNHLRRTVVFDILLLGACIASLKAWAFLIYPHLDLESGRIRVCLCAEKSLDTEQWIQNRCAAPGI